MNLVLVIFVLCVLCCNTRGQDEGDFCKDEKGQDGTCKQLSQCNRAIDGIRNNIFPKICQFRGTTVIVCCLENLTTISDIRNHTSYPDNGNNVTSDINKLEETRKSPGEISRAKCKEYAKYSYKKIVSPTLPSKPQYSYVYDCQGLTEALIVGGILASRKEFPHMAHISYGTDNSTEYLCGGVLISENFVLTAGHCSYSRINGLPRSVRFGVTNSDDTDHRQERKVIEIQIHPDYDYITKYHNIALLRLEEPVVSTSYVRPACLNTERYFNYSRGVVPVWTPLNINDEPGKDLVRNVLNIIPNEVCNKTYSDKHSFLEKGIVDDWMICAGFTSDQRQDTCQVGDSGSPLLALFNEPELQCMHSVLGINSLGGGCISRQFPGMYTRVSTYIKWIEETVWPKEIRELNNSSNL